MMNNRLHRSLCRRFDIVCNCCPFHKLEFGGESPLTIRAWCGTIRYCPDPLGIVPAEQFDKLEFDLINNELKCIVCTKRTECFNSHPIHSLCVDSIVPQKTTHHFTKRPEFIITSLNNNII